jgi:hypothetical protein
MPVPRASQVTLAADEQSRLESIVRAHATPQALAFRCQFILRAAAADCPSHLQVAKELHGDRHSVGRWRSRYLVHGLRGLQDAPRLGRPRRFSPLTTAGCDGAGPPSTCHVPRPSHPLASRCSGGRSGAASPLDYESCERLAHFGGGGPQTASQRLWAAQP